MWMLLMRSAVLTSHSNLKKSSVLNPRHQTFTIGK
jgi:hypothetical protein